MLDLLFFSKDRGKMGAHAEIYGFMYELQADHESFRVNGK